jgi:hypothetical protein
LPKRYQKESNYNGDEGNLSHHQSTLHGLAIFQILRLCKNGLHDVAFADEGSDLGCALPPCQARHHTRPRLARLATLRQPFEDLPFERGIEEVRVV